MKTFLLSLLVFGAFSVHADTQVLKIDRQFYGENSFGHVDGQSYKFFCDLEVARLGQRNGQDLFNYQLEKSVCQSALRQTEQGLANSEEVTLVLECDDDLKCKL